MHRLLKEVIDGEITKSKLLKPNIKDIRVGSYIEFRHMIGEQSYSCNGYVISNKKGNLGPVISVLKYSANKNEKFVKTFLLYSPNITIVVVKEGKMFRRSKLYFLTSVQKNIKTITKV